MVQGAIMADAWEDEQQVWLAGSNQGLFWSRDGGAWEQVGAYRFRVTCIVREGKRTCVGVGSGVWEVPGGSERWVQLHDETLTEVLDLAWIPEDPGLAAASAYGVAVGVRDAIGAVRWCSRSEGLSVNERYANAITVDPGDVQRWVVGTEAGVLVAEEDGRRWTHSGLMGAPVRAVCYALGAWWAGTDGRGIWRSRDGLTWRRVGRGLDEGTVFALRESGGRMVGGTQEGVVVGDGEGLWYRRGPRVLVGAVAVHPEESLFWMAGAVPGGLWVTENGGGHWRYVPDLPSTIEAIAAPERRRV